MSILHWVVSLLVMRRCMVLAIHISAFNVDTYKLSSAGVCYT